MKAMRERPEATSIVGQGIEAEEAQQTQSVLVTQRLRDQYGHEQVAHALSGEDTGPLGTLVLSEWALGTADLGSLVDGPTGSPQQVYGILDSAEWAATSAAVLSRYETSSAPGHLHLAAELIRRSRGQRLPAEIATRLSAALGVDISSAIIHTDAAAAQAAAAVNAHAFATGNEVFFAAGKYKPGTKEGDELLAHELTHVVQDAEGRIPFTSGDGLTVSSPSDSHEREAEHVAHEAIDVLYGSSATTTDIDANGASSTIESEATASSTDNAVLHRSEANEVDQAAEDDKEVNYARIARQIRDAVAGLGTDEEAIFDALSQLNGDPYKVNQLNATYEQLFGTSLMEDLEGDLSGSELERAQQLAQHEKANFFSQSQYGPLDMAHNKASDNGVGGFEATYLPMEKRLIIKVTGKVQFKDAVSGSHPSYSTEHTDLNNLPMLLSLIPPDVAAQILPFFQWSDEQKEEKLGMFKERVKESIDIWQNAGLHLAIDDPEWSEITANVEIQLDVIQEGPADPTEHLQVSIYKEPSALEKAEIDRSLTEANEGTLEDNLVDPGIRANAGTNIHANHPSWPSDDKGTDDNPLLNEMSISSADLDATPNSDQRGGRNHLMRSVRFRSGDATLNGKQTERIQNFIARFSDGDTISENNAITLRGFASRSGSTEYNRELVDLRLGAVQNALLAGGIPSTRITTENRSDEEAESDDVGQDHQSQRNEQRVEIRIGSGERQNTVAHEFGHVFGLSDEYTEGDRMAGHDAWHNHTSTDAGVSEGAMVEQSDNIISVGNEVRPQHYSTFAWALNKLTESVIGSRKWHVKE
jgi:outer membrane protein OmpA-like peptidoglycan-associated protein